MGSFLNVVIHRLPLMMERLWLQDAQEILSESGYQIQKPASDRTSPKAGKRYDLAFPNSHCPSCATPIKWYDNIPILSWLALKGRCRACQASIPIQYPLIEATCALIGIAAYLLLAPNYLQVLLICIFFWGLLGLAVIDLKTGYLPDELTLGLLWVGLLFNQYFNPDQLGNAILGAVLGYSLLWLIGYSFKLIRGIEGLGGGDMKMLAMIGAWFGWQLLPASLLAACLATLAYAGVKYILGSPTHQLKFGPGLALGGCFAYYLQHYPNSNLLFWAL